MKRSRFSVTVFLGGEGRRNGGLTFGNALSVITVVAFLGPRSFKLLFQLRGRVGRGVWMRGRLGGKGIRCVEVVLQQERVRSGLGPEVGAVAQHARSSQHIDVVRRSKNTRLTESDAGAISENVTSLRVFGKQRVVALVREGARNRRRNRRTNDPRASERITRAATLVTAKVSQGIV